MNVLRIKPTIPQLLMVALMLFLFQACEKDEEITLPEGTETEAQILARGGGRGGGAGGGRGGNGGGNGGGSNTNIQDELTDDWVALMLDIDRYAYRMRPTASARAYAYIYLAAYETAAPEMRTYSSVQNHLSGLTVDDTQAPRNLNTAVALNTCFSEVMQHFLFTIGSTQLDQINALETAHDTDLSRSVDPTVFSASKAWGLYVAQQVIDYSQTDQAAEAQILDPQPDSYEPAVAPGNWTYSAPEERAWFPYWESVRTFVVPVSQTTTVAPIPYSSDPGSPYFDQMQEANDVNNLAKAGNNDQLWIAEFWGDDVEGLTFGPPARQYSIARQLVDQYDLEIEEALGFYLKLGFSLNDAAVASWKYKYQHMVQRPSVFIQQFIDPDFETNLYKFIYWPNPSFPSYPSGHSTFASAAAGVFIQQFGQRTNFTDRSHEGRTEFLGTPRTYTSFAEMAEENAFSRIPLGVHIRMDCSEGLRLGYEISDGIRDFDLSQ